MKKFLLFFLTILILLAVPASAFARESSTSPSPVAVPTEEPLQMGATGAEVIIVQERLRALGYLNYRATGKYSEMTFQAVRKFQQNNKLPDDGQIGQSTLDLLLSNDAVIATKNPAFKNVYGPYLETPNQFGSLTSWADIDPLFPAGTQAAIKDLYSGKTFQIVRTGGINNARIETASQADTDVFVDMFGGESTWEKRPVIATINGTMYAASLFGAPGGADTIANNGMQGGTQLFFLESLSDVFAIRDSEHDTSVMKAAGKLA